MLNEKLRKKISENALSLHQYGMHELAWGQSKALELIKSIMNDKIGILGGEVFLMESGRPRPLYDNWFCEKTHLESDADFYRRSKQESLKYIKDYPIGLDEDILFSIIFTDSIEKMP